MKKRLDRNAKPRPTMLVVVCHPDDELLSCAGTIKRYIDAGYRVICVCLTRGERGGAIAAVRTKEAIAGLRHLGVDARDIFFGPFADGEVPYSIETISYLEQFVAPEVVVALIPSVDDDAHQDHFHAARSCLTALCRVPSLLSYWAPSAMGFVPNVFVDITEHMQAKWAALQFHKSQASQGKAFMERDAVFSQAVTMGMSAGVKYAEGFRSIRHLLDICPVAAGD